jgi:hypothetical protein
MARRRVPRSGRPYEKPLLDGVSLDEAREELRPLRELGEELRVEVEAQNAARILAPGLDVTRRVVAEWHDGVVRWLTQRFTTEELANSFAGMRPIEIRSYMGREDVGRSYRRLVESVAERARFVTGLYSNLHLYEAPPASLDPPTRLHQPADAARGASTIVNVQHLGQFIQNPGTVQNIQSHISGIVNKGNSDVGEALARLTNALDDVGADKRAEVSELLHGIACEADAPPEQRSPGRVRAFLRALPGAAEGATKFLELLNEVSSSIEGGLF